MFETKEETKKVGLERFDQEGADELILSIEVALDAIKDAQELMEKYADPQQKGILRVDPSTVQDSSNHLARNHNDKLKAFARCIGSFQIFRAAVFDKGEFMKKLREIAKGGDDELEDD